VNTKNKKMKQALIATATVVLTALLFASCGSSKGSDGAKTFCDTAACMKDTLRFTGSTPEKPYVWITADNCRPGKVLRSYTGMGAELATDFGFPDAKLSKDHIRCLFKGNEYVWILFNDCTTGKGYQYKLPFSKTGSIMKRSNGLNGLDPKFSVGENIVAYTDSGNILIEDASTGKTGMMTFGKSIEIDYDVLHESIDSVNITGQRIWAKIKQDGKWVELEKAITLQ
jgi:hypothetical protein